MILFDDWGLIGLDDYLITCLPKNRNGKKKYGSFLEFEIEWILW
jgi:hypothetical protein